MARPAHAPLRAASAHPAVTPPTLERELKVSIYTRSFGFWEYEGTRAQLEAEDVIPPGTQWPLGKQPIFWCQDGLRFWLRRTRPEGTKGPMSVWTSGDWWLLRCDTPDGIRCADWRIKQKARALEQAIYDQSPQGKREWNERFSRYWTAQKDAPFQALLTRLLPQRKRPGRPRKASHSNNEQQGAA